jgi:hypothetical protein
VVNLTYTSWTTSGGIDGPVDGLQFETAGNYFRMDNLEVELPTPAPEPRTTALCGLALACLGAFRVAARKRSRAALAVPRRA